MEDFYFNITSQDNSYDDWNITSDYDYSNVTDDYDEDLEKAIFILDVVTVVTICISLPLTLMAIYALYCQVRKDHVAPIYVINLLISDLIQLCCLAVRFAPVGNPLTYDIFIYSYIYSLMASVGFMVCIALERYLGIVHPLWYHLRRNIKISVVVCVLVWLLPLVFVVILGFLVDSDISLIIFGVLLFLPLPLFIFFLGGTLKALSASRVPSDEKRRIVGVLVLVLLIYTLLFLPAIILLLSVENEFNITLYSVSSIFIHLSPLADSTLYVFMRKGIVDKLLSSVCCCRMDSDDTNSSSV